MYTNRAARRRARRAQGRAGHATKAVVALGASAALGVGLLGGIGQVHANPFDSLGDLGGIIGVLDDPMLAQFVEVCQDPDGSTPVPDAENPPVAVADCSQSTGGTGVAVVLPDSVEIGGLLEDYTVDLSDVPLVNLGERNIIELISGLALGSNTVKNNVYGLTGVRIDPFAIGDYKTYEQIRTDAALPVVEEDQRQWYCSYAYGLDEEPRSGPDAPCPQKVYRLFGRDIKVSGDPKVRGSIVPDVNLAKRTEALKMVEYLTGEKFDTYGEPVDLPALEDFKPRGSATVKGDGMKVALAMRGGNATAEANTLFGLPGISLAGADHGRTSTATSQLGIATALNMDTDQIKLTWFGKELDFTNLKNSGALDLAGDEGAEMIDQIEGLQIPALKEVSCYGVNTSATAEGLGTCSNYLGTFDFYQDLRDAKPGESRQTQYGLTDVTSLVFGNDALLKQFGMLGGSESTPFMDDLMKNLTSEDDRLKFAKDFVRYTKDVRTEYVMEPVLDDDGAPVYEDDGVTPKMQRKQQPVMVPTMVADLDDAGDPKLNDDGNPILVQAKNADGSLKFEQKKDAAGNPVTEDVVETITAAWLTSDYGLREPITIELMGNKIVLFPAVDVNGSTRPNLIGLPQITRIVDDADRGLLPKIGVVQWDQPFGLGTFDTSTPLDFVGTMKRYVDTVTLDDDLREIRKVVEPVVKEGIGDLADGAKDSVTEVVGNGPDRIGEAPVDLDDSSAADSTDDSVDELDRTGGERVGEPSAQPGAATTVNPGVTTPSTAAVTSETDARETSELGIEDSVDLE